MDQTTLRMEQSPRMCERAPPCEKVQECREDMRLRRGKIWMTPESAVVRVVDIDVVVVDVVVERMTRTTRKGMCH